MIKYFGTDGVRGIANEELTPELAFRLGRIGSYVLTKESQSKPKVIVGRDTHISGYMLANALIAGILSTGVEVMTLRYYQHTWCGLFNPCSECKSRAL